MPLQEKQFSVLQNVQTGSGTHPASYEYPLVKVDFLPEINRLGLEAHHLPSFSAEVKIS